MSIIFKNFNFVLTKSFLNQVPALSCKLSTIKESLPRRPLPPYAHYIQSNYKKISQKYPEKAGHGSEIMKQCAEEWKMMPIEEKQEYINRAKESIALYRQQIELYYEKSGLKVRLELKDKRPRKPQSPFFLFLEEIDREETKAFEFVQNATSKWKSMNKDEKKKFYELYDLRCAAYEERKHEWEVEKVLEKKIKMAKKEAKMKFDKEIANIMQINNKLPNQVNDEIKSEEKTEND